MTVSWACGLLDDGRVAIAITAVWTENMQGDAKVSAESVVAVASACVLLEDGRVAIV